MPEIIEEHFLIFVIVLVFVLFVIIGFLVDKMKSKESGVVFSNSSAPTQTINDAMPVAEASQQMIAEAVAKPEVSTAPIVAPPPKAPEKAKLTDGPVVDIPEAE